MNEKRISRATKCRMTELFLILRGFSEKKITSKKICELTGWNSLKIRQDFYSIGFCNGVSNGYDVQNLLEFLSEFLGISDVPKKCCIVGLGRLGAAFLDNRYFDGSGMKVVAGFDSNLNRVEILRSVFPLYPSSMIGQIVKSEKIDYAVFAFESNDCKDAQILVDKLVSAKIKGIVNVSGTKICVPENVKLENCSLVFSLINLLK